MNRILWLATADARGHLMRGQLLARALGEQGVEVDLVTTSPEGQDFFAAFGLSSAILSPHYRVEFDRWQNMERWRTEWRMFRYFTVRDRFRRDLAWLGARARARGAQLIVNDSFHPALLVAPHRPAGRALPPIVHIYGQDLRAALEQNFTDRLPRPLAGGFRRFIASSVDAAFARIEHTLAAPPDGQPHASNPRTWILPPAIALPARTAGAVRAGLGVGPEQRLITVYLNPHFRDPSLAAAIEQAFPPPRFVVHAVGEGFAPRPGWHAHDPALADAVGASDLFVSAPGMGALGQARACGVPLVAILTDQPEQAANLRRLRATGHPLAVVPGVSRGLAASLTGAAERLLGASAAPRSGVRPGSDAIPLWVCVLRQLLDEARAMSTAAMTDLCA